MMKYRFLISNTGLQNNTDYCTFSILDNSIFDNFLPDCPECHARPLTCSDWLTYINLFKSFRLLSAAVAVTAL